jgi:hypothetical protein
MSSLPVLRPLSVSWMASPSVPQLKMVTLEADVNISADLELTATYVDGAQSRVRVSFRRGDWVKWSPAYADAEVVREQAYDWTEVPRLSAGSDFPASLRRRQEDWTRTGICPDPRIYEVGNSPWLAEIPWSTSGGEDYHHYLVLGHDAYVEVLATGWRDEQLTDRQAP